MAVHSNFSVTEQLKVVTLSKRLCLSFKSAGFIIHYFRASLNEMLSEIIFFCLYQV